MELPGLARLSEVPGDIPCHQCCQGEQGIQRHHYPFASNPSIQRERENAHQAQQPCKDHDGQIGVVSQAAPEVTHIQIHLLFCVRLPRRPEQYNGYALSDQAAWAVSLMRLTMARKPLPRVTLRCLSRFRRLK